MTKVVPSKTGLAPLAHLLRGHNQQLSNLQTRQTQYTLDDNGNALVIVGDMSNAPVGAFFASSLGTLQATGLTGHGLAVYVSAAGVAEPVWASGGQWVQVPQPTAGAFTVVTVTASKTLALSDANTEQYFNNASTAGTITIPPHSSIAFPVGTRVRFRQGNLAALTVSPGSGVSLCNNSPTSGSIVFGQQASFALEVTQVSTDLWDASWSIAAGAGGLTEVNVSSPKTLGSSDANTEQNWTSASAGTITIPPDSTVNFPIGTIVRFRQTNTGVLTVSPGSGAQLHNNSTTSSSVSLTQEGFALETVKTAANTWIVSWPTTTGAGATVDETVANYQPVGATTNLATPTILAADSGHQHQGVSVITPADSSIVVTSSDGAGHGAVTLSAPGAGTVSSLIQGTTILAPSATSPDYRAPVDGTWHTLTSTTFGPLQISLTLTASALTFIFLQTWAISTTDPNQQLQALCVRLVNASTSAVLAGAVLADAGAFFPLYNIDIPVAEVTLPAGTATYQVQVLAIAFAGGTGEIVQFLAPGGSNAPAGAPLLSVYALVGGTASGGGGGGATVDGNVAHYKAVAATTNLTSATSIAADSGHQHQGVLQVLPGTNLTATSTDGSGHGVVTLNSAAGLTFQNVDWLPQDVANVGWTLNPMLARDSFSLVAGTIYLFPMKMMTTQSIGTLWVFGNFTSLTVGGNHNLGLYSGPPGGSPASFNLAKAGDTGVFPVFNDTAHGANVVGWGGFTVSYAPIAAGGSTYYFAILVNSSGATIAGMNLAGAFDMATIGTGRRPYLVAFSSPGPHTSLPSSLTGLTAVVPFQIGAFASQLLLSEF